MPKYSVGIHANRLRTMLKKERPQLYCPAAPKFVGEVEPLWTSSKKEICSICLDFVDIDPEWWDVTCPCHALKSENAIRISKEKLDEYYKMRRK